MPMTFSDLLTSEAIDPKAVHLVRHQKQSGVRKTPYWLWRNDRAEFERYQCIQGRPVFRTGNLVASFVAPSSNETLFAGLYLVDGKGIAPQGMRDPIGDHSVAGLHLYSLSRDNRLSEYSDKLLIDWGPGYRSWVQRAHKKTKHVVELRRKVGDPAFPGYLHLITTLSEVESLPESWTARLREARGIYVLTCPRTHELYVGSATGEGGFYERWCQHAAKGGDAVRFRSREASDYQVSVLEVAGSNASERDILYAEQLWMKKLQTNEMGLNGGSLRDGRSSLMSDKVIAVAAAEAAAPTASEGL